MKNDERREHLKDTLFLMKWTHEQAADKLGVNVRTVRRYLSGETPVPPLVTFYCSAVMLPQKAGALARQVRDEGVSVL